jgi:Tol biopolymer transport system component
MLDLVRESRRMIPARMSAVLAALVLLLTVPPLRASGQDETKPGTDDKLVLPGRIFVVCSAPHDPLVGLVAVDPNTGLWSKVTDERDPIARVSPDGKFAVLRSQGDDRSIWAHDLVGKKEPLAVFGDTGLARAWYPDSEHILVTSYVPPLTSGRFETWRVSADGSKKEKLATPDTEFAQDMSTDGEWIVTLSSRLSPDGTDPGPIGRRSLYLMHPDGTGERVLRSAEAPKADGGETVNVFAPRFSPDGRKLLWSERATTPGTPPSVIGRIVVVDCDGTHRRVLVEGKAEDRVPLQGCWSPDGRAIAVTMLDRAQMRQQAIHQIEIVDAAGKPIRIVPLPELERAPRSVIDWR